MTWQNDADGLFHRLQQNPFQCKCQLWEYMLRADNSHNKKQNIQQRFRERIRGIQSKAVPQEFYCEQE